MSKQQLLLKTQKNEVFNILLNTGQNPAGFSWSQEFSKRSSKVTAERIEVSVLIYQGGESYFLFDNYGHKFFSEFSPGDKEFVQTEFAHHWFEQRVYVESWANYLKREIDAPDLWREVEKYRDTFSLLPPDQLVNEPIPAYEVEQIVASINLLADKIEEQFGLNEDQNNLVRSRLNYLVDASKRQGRLDWIHTAIGVLVTISISLTLAPEKAQRLWQLFKDVVGKSIQFIGLLMQ